MTAVSSGDEFAPQHLAEFETRVLWRLPRKTLGKVSGSRCWVKASLKPLSSVAVVLFSRLQVARRCMDPE